MWPLLKTQWSETKYPLILTMIFPMSFTIYRVIQRFDEWATEPPVGNLTATLLGLTFGFKVMELVYRQSAKERNPFYLLTRLPVAHWKLHIVRFLSGSALLGSVITLIAMAFLFFMRNSIGDRYITIAAFHGLLLSAQILGVIVEDVIYKWFRTDGDGEGICILIIPIIFLLAVGLWVLYPTKIEDYTFSLTEIIVLNLLPIAFLCISFTVFRRRKSYLP